MTLKAFHNERGDGTTVLFTALNMILLAFFIMLSAISVIDENRKRAALGSLLGTIGILPGGLNPGKSEGKNTVPPVSEFLARNFNVMEFIRQLEKFSIDEDVADEIILNIGKENILLILSGNLAFDEGGAVLTPRPKSIIERTIPIFENISGEVSISGHAGLESHSAGPYPDEWTLSFARAGNTARLLESSGRIRSSRISVSGYAYIRPLLKENTPLSERFKDRVEIYLRRERS